MLWCHVSAIARVDHRDPITQRLPVQSRASACSRAEWAEERTGLRIRLLGVNVQGTLDKDLRLLPFLLVGGAAYHDSRCRVMHLILLQISLMTTEKLGIRDRSR